MLAGEQTAPSQDQLCEWLHPLLDALAVIHRENCLHRDISPDNILLTSAGPVLLDFGAARRVISDMTQSLTAVLKPGFAPIEQYGGAMAQVPGRTSTHWPGSSTTPSPANCRRPRRGVW